MPVPRAQLYEIEHRLERYDAKAGKIDLSFQEIDPDTLASLLPRLAALDGLRVLDIQVNHIGDAGTIAIAKHLKTLRSLNVTSNTIGVDAVDAIACHLTGLTQLDIADNPIGNDGAIAIAKHLTSLVHLNICDNGIDVNGAAAIADYLTKLKSLLIGGNPLGDAGAIALASAPAKLQRLLISHTRIGRDGAIAIAKGFTDLIDLSISLNRCDDAAAVAVAESLSQLRYLDIQDGNITDTGAIAIAAHLRQLNILKIACNQIGNPGAMALIERLSLLTSLDLAKNRITSVQKLAEALRVRVGARNPCTLEYLDVAANPLHWPEMEEDISETILQIHDPTELLARLEEVRDEAQRSSIYMARLVMIGPTEHGKSHLAKWLTATTEEERRHLRRKQDRGPAGEGTWGTQLLETQLTAEQHRQPDLPDCSIRIFDCGGHLRQLQSHHNLVFSNWNRSIFLLCLRADRGFNDSWGDYYLGLIADLKARITSQRQGTCVTPDELVNEQHRAGSSGHEGAGVRVIMVPTHADEAKKNGWLLRLPGKNMLANYSQLLELSETEPWYALKGENLAAIKQAIGEQLANLPELRAAIPAYVTTIRDELEQEFAPDANVSEAPARFSMSYHEFSELCARLDVEDIHGRHRYILQELDNLGYVVAPHCHDMPPPATPHILNPLFVQRFLYQGLLNFKPRPHDGVIRERQYRELIRDPARRSLDIRIFSSLAFGDWRIALWQFVPLCMSAL